ncbi:phospholipase B1, membrane-associated-like [Apostichopus japonicus]|uniref:phospholipase B1, membrane-associated-like n=1 Tax=Stichopus japonicus TaxID=307972 RepID=UPI003AB6E9D7
MKLSILILCSVVGLSVTRTDFPANYQSQDEWLHFLDVVNSMTPKFDDDIHDVAEDENPLLCRINYVSEFPFTCPPMASPIVPTSVHELTPADISVIGALGDSLTAAFGIESCTVANLAREYRGLSWSVGGDEDINTVLTLANLIKFYNPELKGYSRGIGGPNSPAARFNVAVSGARAEHMPGQAWELVERILADPEVDNENDWKVVTMFIGTNDLCQHCLNINKYSTEQFVEYIRQALDIMHENLPRTFVNVLGILLIPEVGYYSTPRCDVFHALECPCAMFLEGDDNKYIWDLTRAYQKQTEALIMSGRYDTRDDFTVVYQPFLEDTHKPFLDNGEVDASYFAPDCFHYSTRAHAVGAKDIWNNMLQPVGEKDKSWNPQGSIHCPSEDFPYFYTNLNSKQNAESISSLTIMSSSLNVFLSFLSVVLFVL